MKSSIPPLRSAQRRSSSVRVQAAPSPRPPAPAPVAVLLTLAAVGGTQAQDLLVSPMVFEERVPTVQQTSSNWVGSAAPPPLYQPPPQGTPLAWGPVRFRPRLGYQLLHGDGLPDAGGDTSQKTTVHTFTPGLAMDLGRNWQLEAVASITRYEEASYNNSVGYSLGLDGRVPFDDWELSAGYRASRTEQPEIETGRQTLQDLHSGGLTARINPEARLYFEANLESSLQVSHEDSGSTNVVTDQDLSDYWSISTTEWVNYKATPRTTFGAGVSLGYNLVNPGFDSAYEQLLGRVVWLPGPKLSMQASAGVHFQQFIVETPRFGLEDDVDLTRADMGIFPTFDARIVYKLFEKTTLSLNGSHKIGMSSLENRFTETTGARFGLRQNIHRSLFLDVVPGYSFQRYRVAADELQIVRKDSYFSVYTALSARFFKKLEASIFYQYADNSSNEDQFDLDSTQVGLQLNFRY